MTTAVARRPLLQAVRWIRTDVRVTQATAWRYQPDEIDLMHFGHPRMRSTLLSYVCLTEHAVFASEQPDDDC